MTTAILRHIDRESYDPHATEPFQKPWNKVDRPGKSYCLIDCERAIRNLRGQESEFSVDISGFAVYKAPTTVTSFEDDEQIRGQYYDEVKQVLHQQLSNIKEIVIFDHTIRRKDKSSPRQPVQLVHIDQTPSAAEARVRRHLGKDKAETFLNRRYQIVNVWRPIQYPAFDSPLAVIDWRSMDSDDLVKVDLLYPKNSDGMPDILSDPGAASSTDGYEVKGEQYAIAPKPAHAIYYLKDMTPDEVMLIKCFDSASQLMTDGKTQIAHGSGHTAFIDPQTAADAPARQSIEVRCLVFYE
ncbi:methyltransferase [Colletotrichum nymphaeae SA-01]|uniref:Methyltransferase n=1 Tax=Colletotrichum nymphaeae SA-01 TaxID=1460502 RepID=A0A135UKZ6_9PEZI|nr:methyltransferase [Colletotrichum nymphaeae SA-01]